MTLRPEHKLVFALRAEANLIAIPLFACRMERGKLFVLKAARTKWLNFVHGTCKVLAYINKNSRIKLPFLITLRFFVKLNAAFFDTLQSLVALNKRDVLLYETRRILLRRQDALRHTARVLTDFLNVSGTANLPDYLRERLEGLERRISSNECKHYGPIDLVSVPIIWGGTDAVESGGR